MKVIVNNIATEYQIEGDGAPVLFLHGWGDNLHTFDAIVSKLADTHKIIRLDLPGFGRTEIPPDNWNLENYVEFVSEFLKKINITPDYFVGHSFGGRILIKGMAEGKLSAKKNILISSAGIKKSNSLRNQSFFIVAKMGKAMASISPFKSFRDKMRKKLYEKAGSDYLETGPLKKVYLNIIREDLSREVSKIKIPTLLIWGDKDNQTPVSDGYFFSQEIKNSQIVVLKDKGHFVHQEDPSWVAKLINEFCV